MYVFVINLSPYWPRIGERIGGIGEVRTKSRTWCPGMKAWKVESEKLKVKRYENT